MAVGAGLPVRHGRSEDWRLARMQTLRTYRIAIEETAPPPPRCGAAWDESIRSRGLEPRARRFLSVMTPRGRSEGHLLESPTFSRLGSCDYGRNNHQRRDQYCPQR